MRLHVLPGYPSNRLRNNRLRDSKPPGYFGHAGNPVVVFTAYFKDQTFGEFRLWKSSAYRINISSLFYHILHVVLERAYEKVKRIYALRVVAFMANKSHFLNSPTGQDPGNPVGKPQVSAPLEKSVLGFNGLPDITPNLSENPTAFWCGNENMRPESGPCVWLDNALWFVSIWTHNQIVWLCHALGCSFTARALCIMDFSRTESI